MSVDKNKHLECVLKSHNIENNESLMNAYRTKRDEVREDLKAKYADTIYRILHSGNVYIRQERLLIYVEGKKKPIQKLDLRDRPFNKAGLKVVYQLLIDQRLIDATIREIALRAQVSLDSVHKTINGLKELGYLIPLDRYKMRWKNRRDLLEKWVSWYDIRLKPALFIGSFRFVDESNYLDWRKIRLGPKTRWVSEPAGDIYTDNLKPEVLTIYTNESRIELIKKIRIIPDEEGDIRIYNKFWDYDPTPNEETVNPVLIYADLINTGNNRNIAIANRILNEQIQDHL